VAWFFVRVPKGREPYVQKRVPTWRSPIRGDDGRWITSHVINQDIVAWVGQGRIADRTKEHLRSSDIGVTLMRNRFFEEIEAMAAGKEPGGIIRSANEAQCITLPNMARELNTEGIPIADFQKDPILRQRLKEFRHHFGQPTEVRREFAEAMGIPGA
jgi:5,5'-dehydrodivanillate O-demethylase